MAGIIAHILWYIIYPFSLLPLKVHYFFSDLLAWVLRNIFGYRKSTIYTNLARSFPELKYKELDALAKEYYEYMCDIIVESIWQISASRERILEVVKTESTQLLDSLVEKHSRVIVMLGHRGNWEMIGAFCGIREQCTPENFSYHPIYIGYKAAENKISNLLFEMFRYKSYKKFNNPGNIVESNSILHSFSHTRGTKCTYLFIADQSPLQARVITKFLNQPTLMFQGAEFMARRENVPVVYLDMKRERRGQYILSYKLITESSSKTSSGDITRAYARMLEEHINENRHNWLWSHKRWKREFTPKERSEYEKLFGS